MPVKVPAYRITCQNCGWSRFVAPRGDVLTSYDKPGRCPQCRSANLKQTTAKWYDHLANLLNIRS